MREASHTVEAPYQTMTAWRARKAATGDVQAKVGYRRGHSHKIPDPAPFKAFVQAHGEATLEKLAEVGRGEAEDHLASAAHPRLHA